MQWHIGTSGWSYERWRGPFYPANTRPADYLAYYARYFDAVEINNSFYHLPTGHQLALWQDVAPRGFVFCIKGSRYITHNRKLKDAPKSLPPLLDRMDEAGMRGPVVFQLPPHFKKNRQRLAQFLAALPHNRRYAIEFRDLSWHDGEVYGLLNRHNVAFCLFEKGKLRSPRLATADFIYVRLHGRKENYKGNYSKAELADWHAWLKEQRRDAYVFFDNTDEKIFAVENALAFQRLAEAA